MIIELCRDDFQIQERSNNYSMLCAFSLNIAARRVSVCVCGSFIIFDSFSNKKITSHLLQNVKHE